MLVLTGAGEQAFCAGADLKAIDTLDPDLPGGPLGFTRLTSPKPAIAAVSGYCLAGGFELALWCDLRVATEDAAFGCAERRWGVPLIDGGTQRLARIAGQGRALDLVLTGRMVSARRGARHGDRDRGRAARRAPRHARWRWPRGWPRSRRTRCSPTGARCSTASGCRSTTGSRSRRGSAARCSTPRSGAPGASPAARAAAAADTGV